MVVNTNAIIFDQQVLYLDIFYWMNINFTMIFPFPLHMAYALLRCAYALLRRVYALLRVSYAFLRRAYALLRVSYALLRRVYVPLRNIYEAVDASECRRWRTDLCI